MSGLRRPPLCHGPLRGTHSRPALCLRVLQPGFNRRRVRDIGARGGGNDVADARQWRVCTEHVLTFSLSLFPGHCRATAVCLALTVRWGSRLVQEGVGHGRTCMGCARLLPGLGGTGARAGLVSVGSWGQPSGDTNGHGASACRGRTGGAWKRVSSGGRQTGTFAPIGASADPGAPPAAPGPSSVPCHRWCPDHARPRPSPTARAVRSSRFPYFFFFLQWLWTRCVFLYGK